MFDIGEIIGTVLGFTVAGLVMMVIGFFTLKYFVRMIMSEIFLTLKQRVMGEPSSKKELKKQQDGFARKK